MLPSFLRNLFDGQPALVGLLQPVDEEAKHAASMILRDFELLYRQELPGAPPAFDAEAALWSAVSIYHAATLMMHRDAGPEVVDAMLGDQQPPHDSASAHYSVDLTMRFLPDLTKLAKSMSPGDRLVEWLDQWALAWPLSSVGIGSATTVDATPLRTSTTLMRLYADRIIATNDVARLHDTAAAEYVKVALGDYPEISPHLARQLNISGRTTHNE